jgi:hypothetical protein
MMKEVNGYQSAKTRKSLWNTAFQYHFLQYFWPELEVNYEYWPNGEHQGLSQVLLTPGIIFGRLPGHPYSANKLDFRRRSSGSRDSESGGPE